MSFNIRAQFFFGEDSLGNFRELAFSENKYLKVASENFNTTSYIEGTARTYAKNFIGSGNGQILIGTIFDNNLSFENRGNGFDIDNLYLLSKYRLGQLECITAEGSGGTGGSAGLGGVNLQGIKSSLINVELDTGNPILPRITLINPDADSQYHAIVDIVKYSGLVVNKAYHKMLPSGDGSSRTSLSINMTQKEIDKVPTNNIYINYSRCFVINFKINPLGIEDANARNFYYTNLIIIENKESHYLEDFSAYFYYDAATQRYYLDDLLTECSVKTYEDVLPYLLLRSSDDWSSRSVLRGSVKLALEKVNDATLENVPQEINFDRADVCGAAIIVAGNNQIACTDSPGIVSINVNGVITLKEDQQICPIGGTAKTVIAVFLLKADAKLVLYKDFSTVNTVKADIWGYNFRYIDYFDGQSYYPFKDNGSVSSVTISYIDQVLDLSKYFGIREESDGLTLSDSGSIVALTLSFKIYRVNTTDGDATDYFLDVPVEILSPQILTILQDSEAKKIIIKTNYATRLVYNFNEEAGVPVSITDTADGQNQETIVDYTGKIGTFYVRAFNYYYDLSGATRDLYATEKTSLELTETITIPEFTLRVKIANSTKTIFDDDRSTYSSLDFLNLNQSEPLNYFVYSTYKTETGKFTFQLDYDLTNSKYSSMFLKIGDSPALQPLILKNGTSSFSLSKQDLFESLKNNQVLLSFLADGNTPFNFPFNFFNVSPNDPPVCDAFSLSRVQLNYPNANIYFDISYSFADELEYSVIDQDDGVLYGPILIKERFRDIESFFVNGTPRQRSIKIENVKISNTATTLRVRAIVRNIKSATEYAPKQEDEKISSNPYSLPLKIGSAEVVLFSDENLTTEIQKITKGEDFYAFLQIKDLNDAIVDPLQYGDYLAANYKVKIVIIESDDANIDLAGVISSEVDKYTVKFNIQNTSVFNDTSAVFQAEYLPIIDSEI
jgi:hypothetical protein